MSDVLQRILVRDRSVFPAADVRLEELARDITAFFPHLRSADEIDPIAFLGRPTVLRRLASVLAPLVPTGVDRLVEGGADGGVLAGALALETGIPFALLGSTEDVRGEVHPGESVLVLGVRCDTGLSRTARLMSEQDVRVAAGLTVLGPRANEDWPTGVPLRALFGAAAGNGGRLVVTAEETT
jgi:hypothetical protein